MLKSLTIKNFAIIESLEIEFDKGLNIIIGETGAGKSIIIDSLSILLGEKALSSYIRTGEKKAVIEGVFVLPNEHSVFKILQENDIELIQNDNENLQTIIRREIAISGNSRIFINDTPVSFNLLNQIGDLIIDFHGQYAHQSLLNPKNHIAIIDAFALNIDLVKQYKSTFAKLKTAINQYKSFLDDKHFIQKQIEELNSQFEEIHNLNPSLNEDIELENELKILENSEIIHSNLSEIYQNLFKDDAAVYDRLSVIEKKTNLLAKYDATFEPFLEELNNINSFFKDFINTINNYLVNFDFSPDKIDLINQRLFNLNKLKRKYGSIEEIIKVKEEIWEKLENYRSTSLNQDEFLNVINKFKIEIKKIASELSNRREKVKNTFQIEIAKILRELGFNHIEFKIQQGRTFANQNQDLSIEIDGQNYFLNENGLDTIEFLISTNLGEEPKELIKIASGGEISRIMLALKSMAANDVQLPVLVFDEIDAGVSGHIAQKVGKQMRKLSKFHQIICITHSPQVAASGTKIISIEKIVKDNRTTSVAKSLNDDEKIMEIAKFLSGSNITETSIINAKELIASCQNNN
jgi:DNA repair protein RecN (Recombination protein N)